MSRKFETEDCPICHVGKCVPHNDGEKVLRHKGKDRRLTGLHYSICNHCGTQGMTEDQAEENRRLITAFEDGLKDYISPANIRAIRQKYRISQVEAAAIFGCGTAYFSKWERGEVAPSGSCAVLLKAALRNEATMLDLAKQAGVTVSIPPKKPDAEIQRATLALSAWVKAFNEQAAKMDLQSKAAEAISVSNRLQNAVLSNYRAHPDDLMTVEKPLPWGNVRSIRSAKRLGHYQKRAQSDATRKITRKTAEQH